MTAAERIVDAGFEDVIVFDTPAYDDALLGVDTENRAVYDYNKMIEGLMTVDGMSEEDAVEWIDYNTICSLPYVPGAPIIVYPI